MKKFFIGVGAFLCLFVLKGNNIPLPPGWSLNMIEPSPDSGGCTSCKLKSSQNTLEIPFIHESGRVFLNVNLSTIPIVDNVLFTVKLGSLIPYSPTQAYRIRVGKRTEDLSVIIGGVHIPFPISLERLGKNEIYSAIYPQYSIRKEDTCLILSDSQREYLFAFAKHMRWYLTEIREKMCVAKAIRIKYDENDQMSEVLLPNDQKYVFNYDGSLPVRLLDPAGAVTEIAWKGRQLIAITTTLLPEHPFYSTSDNNLNIVRDIHIDYDEQKRIISAHMTNGDSYVVEYRSEQNPSEKINMTIMRSSDGSGEFTRLIADVNGKEKKREIGSILQENGIEDFIIGEQISIKETSHSLITVRKNIRGEETQYVRKGEDQNKTAFIDALGRVTSFIYNEKGQLITEVYPDDSRRVIDYNTKRQVVREIARDGILFEYIYENNRLISSAQEQLITRYYYNDLGLPIKTVLPDGSTHDFEWDNLCRLISHTRADGVKTLYSYAGLLNILCEKILISNDNKERYSLKYQYNPQGRLVKILYPDATSEAFIYNCCNLIKYVDRTGAVTQYAYDRKKQKILELSPDKNKTIFQYNNKGWLQKIIYPDKTARSYEYDTFGRIQKEIKPDGTWGAYSYDAAGNIIELATSNGTKSQYTYDEMNRMISVSGDASKTYRYIYNTRGYLEEIHDFGLPAADVARVTSYKYDSLGRITVVNYPDGTTEVLNYDSQGRLLYKHNGALVTFYFYNSIGKIAAISEIPAVEFFSSANVKFQQGIAYKYQKEFRTYDHFGHLKEIKMKNGLFRRFQYLPDGLLHSVLFPVSDTLAHKKTYIYTYSGNGKVKTTIYSKFIEF